MTVEQWLGEDNTLGIDIWHKKYQYNNETFDEWLDRVSGYDEEVKKLIKSKKFLFGGRILSNRDIPTEEEKTTYSNCFIAGTNVLTSSGYKNIEDISTKDEVLSHDGQFHKVNAIMQRDYAGDLYKLSSIDFLDSIICTPNHKFLTNHDWKRADRLLACSPQVHAQDKLKIAPVTKSEFKTEEYSTIDRFEARENTKVVIENGKAQLYVQINDKGTLVYCKRGKAVNSTLIFDEDFAYFIGRWIGDGSVTCTRGYKNPSILQIVFNAKTEYDAFIRCKEIGERVFGIEANWRLTKQNVYALRFDNEIIATWFINHFGKGCSGKFISDKYIGCFPMMLGLCDADGMIATHGAFRIVLKNRSLIEWLYKSFWINGINACKIKPTPRQEDTYEIYIRCAIANKFLNPFLSKTYSDKRHERIANGDFDYAELSNIEILENFNGKVYNLSVEDTHTYTVNGVVVHNCYVITPPSDDLESIYSTCSKLARTYSYGGGCGIDISKLAPSGAKVRNQAKTTSGAVSFMDTFSQVTEQIGQNGRRGALMISLNCDHPDIERFITIKSDLNKVNYANISVKVTNDFMKAVENDTDWVLTFTRKETNETIKRTVRARDIFNLLCEQNWNYAEPGILFWDTISNYNLLDSNESFEYAGTNPCGEQPLPAGGSCLLGSINLSEFVDRNGKFNFKEFTRVVDIAARALNTVLDEGLPKHPLEEQRSTVKDWRQIGLGIFGLADMLIKMRLSYGEPEAVEVCNQIGNYMVYQTIATSNELAKELGRYDKYTEDVLTSTFYLMHKDFILSQDPELENKIKEFGLRNSQMLTIAPTGTLSTMIGVSGGIEPIFANSYTRTTKSLHGKDVTFKVYTPIVASYMEVNRLTSEEQLPNWFVVAEDIAVDKRIKMQAIWQRHIDASISSTVNLPNSATVDDVYNIYMGAWKVGLKGITVFRSGCARTAILNTEPQEELVEEDTDLIGLETTVRTGCGVIYLQSYFRKDGTIEHIRVNTGGGGGCASSLEGISKLLSLLTKNRTPLNKIIDQLNECNTCPSYAVRHATKKDTSPGSCCPVAIGKALLELSDKFNHIYREEETEDMDVCPDCGAPLRHEEGCVHCTNCPFSKCG